MGPSKHDRSIISGQTYTRHQRLNDALNLGTRVYGGDKARRWQCMDIAIQRHVVHSIAAFLDSVSGDKLHHPLLKASAADIIAALVWILQSNKGSMLSTAANVTVKLVSLLPKSILQLDALDLINPLSSLLSAHQTEVSISCAAALSLILTNLSMKNAKEVWDILEKTESVSQLISNLRSFSECMMPFEHFQQMALLLSTILWWWPPSRFSVWSDAKLMEDLNDMLIKRDAYHKVAVLKLYSAVALCGNGAKKVLEGGEALLEQMVQCMDSSYPYSVRIEAFRLAQCLAINEQKCLQMMSLSCQPIIKAIISGMCDWSSHSRKVTNDQLSLLVEACRLALITRWAGEHHIYFWKQGIDKILLDLLLEKFHNQSYEDSMSLEEQIVIAKEGLNANYLLFLRTYVWDILGWLAIHCGEDFKPETEFHFDILIACACLTFVEAIQKWHKIYENDIARTFRSESATRAVLMMTYSPCKYIASKARFILSETLKPKGLEYLNILLRFLNNLSSGNFAIPDKLQIIIYLMGFICYSGLEEYQVWIIKQKGVKTLFSFVKWCLSNHFQVERLSFAPHLHNTFHGKICCSSSREWEGKDILLLYSLLGLAELIKHSGCVGDNLDRIAGKNTLAHIEAELVSKLQDICNDNCTPGVQWYAAYVLSYFGFYGFPSKLMKRIGKAINNKDSADLQFVLTNGECFSVHGVVLAIQCPSLLPPEGLLPSEVTSDDSSVTGSMEVSKEFQKDIRLSAHVDHQALVMLLEYIYLGYVQAEEELAKKLRTLAKRCNLQPLLQMLCRKRPKWGIAFPSPDLSAALGPSGHRFSDVILEAKETKLLCWTCGVCSLSVPHMHVHKVVLSASCDYLRALFESGMQESNSQAIKVSISWKAMVKLVNYFYSGNLPKPPSGCIWNNMDTEEKLDEVQSYVELFWLSEFWIMEDVQEACSDAIISCLGSARELAIKILQIAANLSLWNLAEVAATYMAPLYRQLCDSGELETLDEMLADMVRVASVRFSQQGGDQFQ
ncbi:putative chromatin remodeling & transcription regulator BTB-POZ family [Rosa chinensis]|uniref:Putative chromatin remodeling & transcription regulator BTB-POZ family n=1 Tax=Rosa chinensis TaxID=74649 RepID=A0A2P6Q8W9_ROSCH|nr:BTB/POZ domain-containing protein At1g04390 isoform X1 [Rosa chinensis]XP_024198749.1 BTB/POZ domain-containing protein At1g04390 isoform X1 [Rosa chinensis]XP_024198750.1 BTB/POZ domain-containing protein At1g04390 isoform X1 [Rosa chinensis]PRQ30625.1 putative chromatin remodeling & transcription regulator BTB-POZ family [Rosa chinensis]